MTEKDITRSIVAEVYARFEYNTRIRVVVSDQATEEEIQHELDEAASLAVAENGQTANGLQLDITVTRQEEEDEEMVEAQPEKQWAYRYEVEVSTYQMLHQTVEIGADHLLTEEQIAERACEEALKGSWRQGTIDQSMSIDNITEA